MTSGPLEPTDAFEARLQEGRELADGGSYENAETLFRGLLDEVRDGHPGNHARALSSLMTLYGRGGRYLEAHLLARQLAQMARDAGPGAESTLAFAYGAICGALSQFGLTAQLQDALDEMHNVLAGVPEGNQRRKLEMEYHEAAAGLAVVLEDALTARKHLEAFKRLVKQLGQRSPVDQWVLGMYESNVALLERQPEIALRHLEAVRASNVTPPFYRLQELPLSVAVHAALGQEKEARRIASEAIGILEAVQSEPFLASDRIQQGRLLVDELEKLGAVDLAQSVYDMIAAAVMIRLQQVDTCMRQLPELGLSDPASTDALANFRKKFLDEQQALLRRVANVLESRGGDHVRSLLTGPEPEGMISLCAWCESVRPLEGRWLPVGHFIPRGGNLRLTHSICPECAQRWGA